MLRFLRRFVSRETEEANEEVTTVRDDNLDDVLAALDRPAGVSKTVTSKLRKAERAKAAPLVRKERSTDRLPPGQHIVTVWPRLDMGTIPVVEKETWKLKVYGEVGHPFELDWAAFAALPLEVSESDLHCVTKWSLFDNVWKGVSPRVIADMAKPTAEVRHVLLHGAEGYTTNLAIEDFLLPDNVLATEWKGSPLTEMHGAPVRMIVPSLYAWKSAKWLVGIEFLSERKSGFWEAGGYHDRGDPWMEQRYKWNDAGYMA